MIEILKNMAKKGIKIILIILAVIIILTAALKEIKIKDAESLYNDLNAARSDIKIATISPRYAEVKTNVYTDVEAGAEQAKSESYISADGSINIDLEAKLQEKIKKLEERNILHTYIREKNLNEYLMAFIKAEFITQYPDLRSADKIGTATESEEFQGCIQIHRALADGKSQILTYIPKSEFETYISNNDMNATNYFTLDSEGNLIIAGWTRVTTNVTTNVPDVENIVDKVEYTLTTNSINYKSLVEVYTMPFDLLWTLTVMGEDEDFSYKLAQLALNSKIIFTVQDNITITTTKNIEEYETQEKTQKNATLKVTLEDEWTTKNVKKEKENAAVSYKTETTIKTETCSTNIDMTYADTWIVKYQNTYSNTTPSEIVGDPEVQNVEDTQYQLVNNSTLASDTEIEEELLKFKIEVCGSEEEYLKREEEGTISGEISKIYYRTYSRTINKKITSSTTTSGNIYIQGTPTVTEKTDKKSEEDNFVKLFLGSKKAKSNILSISDWLFEALEKSHKAADMIDTIKYLLYLSTNNNYGVVKYDFSVYQPSKFSDSKRSVQGLAAYLRQFSHTGDAPQSTDGKYYLMYGDGAGWPTIGTADLQWKSNHSKFNVSGKIIHKGQEKEVPNIAEYILQECLTKGANAEYTDEEVSSMQVGIEKSIVDSIGNTVQQCHYQKVKEATDGLNLSRQQMYALTSITYNFGSLPVRNNKTFKQTYQDGLELYQEGSLEHNMYIWDNWWCALGGGKAGHIPARDAAFETYVKAVFDFSKSEAGEVFGRKYYIYYTREQLSKFDYAPNKQVTRTTENEKELFTMVVASGTFEADWSNPKVRGYYTSTMGKVHTVLNQGQISSWHNCCNRAAAAIIASAYSEQSADELINILNSNKAKYNWDTVPTNEYFNLYGLKLDQNKYGYLNVAEYTEIIRNQLNVGGYAMVWINNGGTYIGKSSETWTTLYHWVAIVDYRIENGIEEIMILDYRGGDWYPIDEFQHGISWYVLISEM